MLKNKSRLAIWTAVVAAGIASAGISRAAVTDDLVVHLTFDNNTQDSSGRNNHGTPVAQPDTPASPPGFVAEGPQIGTHALKIEEGQHVSLGSPADLYFGPDVNFSVSFWIKGPAGAWTGDPPFVGNKSWTSGGNVGWVIAAQGNGGWKWNFRGMDADRRDTANLGVIADGGWHHILVTHDRDGVASFYADGQLQTTISIANDGEIDAGLETCIGNEGTGGYGYASDTGARFKEVYFDDFGLWRRALTGDEVAVIYGAGLQGLNLQETSQATVIIKNLSPTPNASSASALPIIRAEIETGVSPLQDGSVKLSLDGTDVTADTDIVTTGNLTRVEYRVLTMLAAQSPHTIRLEGQTVAGGNILQEWSFTVGSYREVPASYAYPIASAQNPGLLFRSALAYASLPTTVARARAQLDGTLIDPSTGEPFLDEAYPGPLDGYYAVEVVNFEQAGNSVANFPDDQSFPGLDATDVNNFSTETLTYLELQPGYYRLGVNSDDGFELRIGLPPQDLLGSVLVGEVDGGRGIADSLMDIVVTEAGLYPVRLIHFEGGGGAALEFFSVDLETNTKILINDLAHPAAIKAYRNSTSSTSLPYVRSVLPVPGETGARGDALIEAVIVDGAAQVNTAAIQLLLNDVAVTPQRTRSGNTSTVTYQVSPALPSLSVNTVTLIYGDGGITKTQNWSFAVRPSAQQPSITGQWDFTRGDLSATLGRPLEYMSAAAQAATQFGSTEDFGLPNIDGSVARVLRFAGASSQDIGYVCHHGAVPNGDGNKVNRWTIIMDILIPNIPGEGNATWFSFAQLDNLNNSNDGELFANFGDRDGDDVREGGIGIGGAYTYLGEEFDPVYLIAGQWHRVAFAVDHTDNNENEQAYFNRYIDGKFFGAQLRGTDQLDGRHTLFDRLLLFADEDGESQPAFVSSIQIRNYTMSPAEIAALGGPTASGIPTVSGQWDFNGGTLAATLGNELVPRGDTLTSTTFDSDTIAGGTAQVMGFPGATPAQGYLMLHGGLANGGGDRLNQYTLIMDLKYPEASHGRWRGLLQVNTNNTDDGDLFINTGNGIGISGNYQGSVLAETWQRLAVVFDLTQRSLKKFINGELVGEQTLSEDSGGVDQRWSLGEAALLFTDEDNETAAGFVNSIQFRPLALSDAEVAALGGPSAEGIPLALPFVIAPEPPPTVSVALVGDQVQLTWTGGTAPFQVQRKASLTDTEWNAVTTTDQRTTTVPADATSGFFRIVSQ